MTNPPLSQIIIESLTSSSSPVQPGCIPFDPEKHEILGDVPLPAQNLCCAADALHKSARSLQTATDLASAVGDRKQAERCSIQVDILLEQMEILSQICHGLFIEYFPDHYQNFNDFVVVDDWKLAGIIHTGFNLEFASGFMAFLTSCDVRTDDSSNVHFLRTTPH